MNGNDIYFLGILIGAVVGIYLGANLAFWVDGRSARQVLKDLKNTVKRTSQRN